MNRRRLLLGTGVWLLLAFGLGAWAESPPAEAKLLQVFVDAGKAYDEGRVQDAARQYEELVALGYRSPEVLFNLGNAYFRGGALGKAIRSYREAQYQVPRDPDIAANLNFAAQTAGVQLPAAGIPVVWLHILSLPEWMRAATLCFWLAMGTGILWIVFPQWQPVMWRVVAGCVLLLVLSGAGAWEQASYYRHPEWVVMEKGQKALSGPLDSAVALFATPEGALVREVGLRSGWVEFTYEKQRGWLPASALTPVATWSSLHPSSDK